MFAKIALIVIFFNAGGDGYKDFVGVFDTAAQCEEAKAELLKQWPDRDGYVFAACQKPRPVKAVDV